MQSADAGATWHPFGTGLPQYVALRALAIAPSAVYVEALDQYPGTVDGGVFAIATTTSCPAPTGIADLVEFSVPTPNAAPLGITAGPDCAVWFTESKGNKIGRVSASGDVTEFAIPTAASNPSRITTGPDGALWFTEFDANKIGRITTAGAITEFSIPTPNSFPLGITAGPDGNLWFVEQAGRKIGRITPAGVVAEFLVPPRGTLPAQLRSIAVGPDGNLWFTDLFDGRIGRISTTGTVTMFTIEPSCCALGGDMTSGPDGNLWFTEQWANNVVKLTTAGTMTYFPLGTPGEEGGGKTVVFGIAAGSDGALWLTASSGFGRMTTSGTVSLTPAPTADGSPELITTGPDGAVWFTERVANKIVRKFVAAVPAVPERHRSARH